MELSGSQLKELIEIFSELETDKILAKTVQKVSRLLDVKGCSIFLYDESADCLRLAETSVQTTIDKNNIIYERGEGLTGWVFKHRKPLLIQNLDSKSEDDLKQEFNEDLYSASKFVEGRTARARSFLAVPIITRRGRFIGVLRSSSIEANFDENDRELLVHIAGYISKAFENSDLYLQQRIKADYFKLLTDFGTTLHSYYNLKELFRFVAEQAALTFSAETCEIYIADDNNPNRLILKAGWGIPADLVDTAEHQVGEGLTGTLVAENRIIRLKNVLNFPRYKGKYRSKMKKNLKYGDRLAFLGMPISIKSQVIGCIKLYNKIPKYSARQTHFTEEDEKYLAVLVDMLSVAIENHQYRQSMQNSAIQIIKTQRLTALGTMAIRLPNEITNSLATAQIHTGNLQRRLRKGEFDCDKVLARLQTISDCLREVASGVKILREFSTKAGFLKIKKTWQEIIDESLLFLNQEIVHKKIRIHRDRGLEEALPPVLVEPNETIEVMINLLIIALTSLRHFEGDLTISAVYNQNTQVLHTYLRSEDNPTAPLISDDNRPNYTPGDQDVVTPDVFMLNVAREIITTNYKGQLNLQTHNKGVFIEVALPAGGDLEGYSAD